MNAKLTELANRRAVLVARAATQRAVLAQAYAPWRGPLAIVDQGLVAVRYIRNHPALLVGVVALVAVLRPKRVARWLQRGWVTWGAVLAVKRGLSGL
ncbi:MAG: YqjK-like family protein [Gammaproteobacteria bacterium]|nr:YqjK-like family protein [Gammaproteobacteria bacterium]